MLYSRRSPETVRFYSINNLSFFNMDHLYPPSILDIVDNVFTFPYLRYSMFYFICIRVIILLSVLVISDFFHCLCVVLKFILIIVL